MKNQNGVPVHVIIFVQPTDHVSPDDSPKKTSENPRHRDLNEEGVGLRRASRDIADIWDHNPDPSDALSSLPYAS